MKPSTRFHTSIEEIDAEHWNALLPDDNPFVDHAFLAGLEQHGCLKPQHGWRAHHLGLYVGDRLAAAAPMYLKGNSHGEYVFDWSWASAYERNGLAYYPKLLCAVPYSPVPGPRLLTGPENPSNLQHALIDAMRAEAARLGLSSAHLNFASAADCSAFAANSEWLARFDWQFHWHNQGWPSFDDFLEALTPKRRKNIRQERARVARAGVTCEIRDGNELDGATWRAIHAFYRSTFAEKGNYPVLTLPFFEHLGRAFADRILAVLAWRGTELIAMALLLRSCDTLYGRYWGCGEQIPGLHFEACYYQGIEYCLRHGLRRFEPGAQGEHKLARGFLPVATRSFHYIADARFRAAVADALHREAGVLLAYREELMAHSPYAGQAIAERA
jgi:predicted N-acyltransferase